MQQLLSKCGVTSYALPGLRPEMAADYALMDKKAHGEALVQQGCYERIEHRPKTSIGDTPLSAVDLGRAQCQDLFSKCNLQRCFIPEDTNIFTSRATAVSTVTMSSLTQQHSKVQGLVLTSLDLALESQQ